MATMTGSESDDTLIGTAGNDALNGAGGDDWLEGGAGRDNLNGGAGADSFVFREAPYNTNYDRIFGFVSGTDAIRLDAEVFANAGAPGRITYDTTNGNLYYDADGSGAGRAMLIGILHGAPAFAASDISVIGDAPPPSDPPSDPPPITGTSGDDVLFGTDGPDVMLGGAGNDTFEGSLGADSLTGGSGSDEFLFRSPQGGVDRVADFAPGSDTLVFDNNGFTGIGAPGDFGPGDDRFFAGAGAAAGQDAEDRIVYDTSSGNLYFDADGGGAGGARLVAVLENRPGLGATDITVVGLGGVIIEGSELGDKLTGTGFSDTIIGRGGNDTLSGLAGDDWLEGGTGQDQLTGGAGSDSFVFRDTPFNSNYDRVFGFTPGSDELLLDGQAFAAAGAVGDFAAGDARFFAAAGASAGHDADDRIIYNTTNGNLYYDADGSGAGKAMFVGVLHGGPDLDAGDIGII